MITIKADTIKATTPSTATTSTTTPTTPTTPPIVTSKDYRSI